MLYQAARGLKRSFLPSRPATRSQGHFTSAAVKGSPSCHLTPSRSLKVSFVRSSFHDQLSARSGRIVSRLLRRSSWSYTTRPLYTGMNGTITDVDDSSCREPLGRLSTSWPRRIPPDFCAAATPESPTENERAHKSARHLGCMSL